jgi:hypothetical protein
MRFAPDPVGPDDGMVEMLALTEGSGPTARTEAEAIAETGAAWPMFDDAVLDAPLTGATLADWSELDDSEEPAATTERGLGNTDGSGDPANDGFSAVDPGEAFLDLEIDFEELETPIDREVVLSGTDVPRERTERYDSIAPEDLGLEWLARATETSSGEDDITLEEELERRRLERMDTLEDIREQPTDPAESRPDPSVRLAERTLGAGASPKRGQS